MISRMADKSPARAKGHPPRQKRRWFLFCWMRASGVFSQAIPFPPRLIAEREEDEEGKVKSRPFLSSAPALMPGQRQSGSEPRTKWEMIRILLMSIQTLMLLERNKLLIGYYSERQKKVVMVKEPALSRKSPHPPLVKGGQGGISGYPFARFRKTAAVMSTYLGRSL